jgi:uncharacterized DUF497 family protein
MATVVDGDFEWDDAKAASNLTKHGVTFEEAMTVFADEQALYLDDGNAAGRIMVVGIATTGRPLTVVHVDTLNGRIRIISARKATASEEVLYTQG